MGNAHRKAKNRKATMNLYLKAALLLALLFAAGWIIIKVVDIFVSDINALRAMSDDQLLESIKWEKAEGRSAAKLEAEYARRHGELPC